MNHVRTLQPALLRTAIGFDSMLRMIDEIASGQGSSYPPCNIEKVGENAYQLVMAVAGFARDDLEIVLENGALSIKGSIRQDQDDNRVFLHRGIGLRSFVRSFKLSDNVHVRSADLRDGLLLIDLEREVPEAAKPRRIEISSQTSSASIVAEKTEQAA